MDLAVVANPKELESEENPQKSLNEKQQDLLIKCMITQNLGFSGGKPVAACVIYKCLLHWRSFEVEGSYVVEGTSVFRRIFHTILSSIHEAVDNNDVLAYWLCNTSTLIMLLLDGLRQVEAKFPALLFMSQIEACHEKIFGMIRWDNLERAVSPLIGLCIQAPRASRLSVVNGHSQDDEIALQALIVHWQSIVKSLDKHLKTMKANYVPAFLVRKVFTQTFSFINAQLFNSVLLRRECCSMSYGKYAESGLAELEKWCCLATEDYVGSAWDELKHIRQAVGFLVIHQKPEMTLNDLNEHCPVLSLEQLYRIVTLYWDDKYDTHSVDRDVISRMRDKLAKVSKTSLSRSFLLDEHISIRNFSSVEDLYKSKLTVEAADVELSPLIRENSGLEFLHQRMD